VARANLSLDASAVWAAVTTLDGRLPMRGAFVDALCQKRGADKVLEVLKEQYPVIKGVEIQKDTDLRVTMVFPA